MDVCILNSGFGSRLKRHTAKVPKALVPLGDDHTLLELQLSSLERLGSFRYAITTGYLDGMIQSHVEQRFPGLPVTYFPNRRYDTTNYITSLLALQGSFDDELVLLHGDLLFERSVMEDVLRAKGSVVVVDSTLPLPEKDFKARVVDGKVVEIGVDVFGDDCHACQPLYHLTKRDWNVWQRAIADFCARGETGVYAEHALNSVGAAIELYPLDVKGRICMEIDDESDLEKAKRIMEQIV
jgi:phosphoenolpyruvate phosphomutase